MINPHWCDMEILQQDHEWALELVKVQGIKICLDPAERALAKETLAPITSIFYPDLLCSILSLIYLYDMDKQPLAVKKSDGYSSVSERQSDGRRVASIGISLQALHAGKDYAVLVFLHELCHCLYSSSPHGTEFHQKLDFLLKRYNMGTGSDIKNDYQGLAETDTKGL